MRWTRLALGVGLFAWLAWLVHDLSGGVFGGEAIYLRSGLSMVRGDLYQNPTHMHAPIVKYSFGVAQEMFGVTAINGRLVSIAFGAGTLLGVWYLGRLVASERAGLLAAAALALTYEFVVVTPAVLLETGMLFFLVVAIIALQQWTAGDLDPMYFGVAVFLLGATKVQAGVLVIAILAVAATERPSLRAVGRFAAGAIMAGIVVYLPYLLVPAPDYYGGAGVPGFAQTILDAPLIGGVAYVWAAMLFQNLGHVSAGHGVQFLGESLQRAPFWAYPVWLVTRGGLLHLLGLGTGAYLVVTERSPLARVGGVAVLTFVILSAIPVRLPRYADVLYPMTAVVFAGALDRSIDDAREYVPAARRVLPVAALLLLLPAALSLPATPAPDTGYGEVGDYIETDVPDGSHIVADNPAALSWHLGLTTLDNYNYNVTKAHNYTLASGKTVTLSASGNGCLVVRNAKELPSSFVARYDSRVHHISAEKGPLYIVQDVCGDQTSARNLSASSATP